MKTYETINFFLYNLVSAAFGYSCCYIAVVQPMRRQMLDLIDEFTKMCKLYKQDLTRKEDSHV